MDKDFNSKFVVLDAKPIVGRHTAAELAPALKDSIAAFEIDKEKCHAIVRDGAMRATTELAGFDSIWCLAHILNRVILYN